MRQLLSLPTDLWVLRDIIRNINKACCICRPAGKECLWCDINQKEALKAHEILDRLIDDVHIQE